MPDGHTTPQSAATIPGQTCADCGDGASGWIGADDAPELDHDFYGRVWLCDPHLDVHWIGASRGRRPSVPGQLALNLIGDTDAAT